MSLKSNPLTRGKKQKARALLQHNRLAEALPLLEQVCRADQRDAQAWFTLAATYQKLGAHVQAAETYRRVIALEPQYAEARYYFGNTCLALGDGTNALAAFRDAIRLRPDYLDAYVNLGALLELQKDFAAAEACFRQALHLDPRNAELHFNLGNMLQSQGKPAEAVKPYRQAIALRPDYAAAYNNLGNALVRLEQHDEALACYRQALKLDPRLAAASNNMGNTYARQRCFEEAIACYQRALAIDPRYAEAQTNLGNIQRYQGKLGESIASHCRAIEFNPNYPDAHFNLALIYLLTGNFKDGWQEYAWHWLREGAGGRPFPPAAWDGSDLGSRPVFLHGEQGLGDELFFLRFVPWLKQRGAGRIVYRPAPKIASLLARVPIIDRLATPGQAPAADDVVFAIGDLPRLLGMERPDQIPPSLSLVPLPQQLAVMRHRLAELGPPPYVGVTWRAGMPDKELVLYKDSPLAGIAEVLKDVPGTILILQRLPQAGEVEAFSKALGRPTHDLSALNEDLEQMLALLALIDDYVGVSNTNMHLRAAVGRTARVLVPAPPEWRWMADGKESPWFPGFTVYRQGYGGEWEGAFADLARALSSTSPK